MRLLKVGRDQSCDIVLHSDKASALHAEITILNNGDILLEDKNSRNGTFVMNRPIKPGTQVSIKRGDAVRFGDVELIWNQVPMPEDLSNYKAVYGIGTSMRNDIQLSGNTVSRYHATLKVDRKGKAYLQDHSKNGSTINGERLAPGQTRQVKKSDSVTCGGVPVNVSQYIPGNNLGKVLGFAAAIAFIIIGGWIAWTVIPWNNTVNPVTTQAMENASACVYGGYYIEVTLKDNPMLNEKFGAWPSMWYFGLNNNGSLAASTNKNDINPIPYTGTAFFISKDGEMGTNRHVAVPWKYIDKELEEVIRDHMKKMRSSDNERVGNLLGLLSAFNQIDQSDAIAKYQRFVESDIEIGGSLAYFGVGLTGTKVNNSSDLLQAQVIAESEDPKKDVALIRLNSRKTPDYLINMGAIYDIEKARTDERTLTPQDEELIITGYPKGETVGLSMFNGTELRPTIHKASLSKTPDDNQIQIQAVGIGGQSGSPVIDKTHRLVGVLCSGFTGTEVTYCCNIKHLVDLYNKHRVRE